MLNQEFNRIEPRSGVAFILKEGQKLYVRDPRGEQVSDLFCFGLDDKKEYLSSGRTIDYNNKIFFTSGDKFYSNRSRVMFDIVEDTVGRHDFLLTPCSKDTFRIIYGHEHPHQGCFGNLVQALSRFGIEEDDISVTFNIFMHVALNSETGAIAVLPPKSKEGDYICIRSHMDLIVGLTACSAEQSNNYAFKPIDWRIE